jgi:hypothetical protein
LIKGEALFQEVYLLRGEKRVREIGDKEFEPVAQTCNLSYSGGRDQEDRGSEPALARDPISKNPITQKNWAGGVAQGEGSEFKPQYWGKKKNNKKPQG